MDFGFIDCLLPPNDSSVSVGRDDLHEDLRLASMTTLSSLSLGDGVRKDDLRPPTISFFPVVKEVAVPRLWYTSYSDALRGITVKIYEIIKNYCY